MAKQAQSNSCKNGGRKTRANMVILAEHSAFSRSFDALFAEGMALADKMTADFDRSARAGAASAMPPEQAEFYARERKKLGAAALKMAAWLWVEKALREGDISPCAAAKEKEKLNLALRETAMPPAALSGQKAEEAEAKRAAALAALPAEFRRLRAEIEHFTARIRLMDKEINRRSPAAAPPAETSSVGRQWQALRHAFGAKRG